MSTLRSPVPLAGFLLGPLLAFSPISAAHAAPPPEEIDTTSILEMEASPEEKMIYGELPAVPETGNENPEDLLKSSPIAMPPRKGDQRASSQSAEPLPKKLKELPSTPKSYSAEEELPPEPQADFLMPEAPTEIPLAESEEALPEAVVPAEPEAEAETLAADTYEPDGTVERKWDRDTPMYDREKPNWAFEIHGSPGALGTTDLADEDGAGNISEYVTRNFGLGFEWQPEALQGFGVFSLGINGNLYILSNDNGVYNPAGDLTSDAFSIYAFGARAMYQLRYFDAQPIVPFVGFEAQQIHYRFAEYSELGSGWTLSTGPTFGVMLLMNWMEPSAAHNLWVDAGINRTYLVAEMKMMTAGLPELSVEDAAYYFGIRMEY